jgi:hypothetical protein
MKKMNERKIILVLSDGQEESLKARNKFRNLKLIQSTSDDKTDSFGLNGDFNFDHEKLELAQSQRLLKSFHSNQKIQELFIFTHSEIVFNFFRVMVKEKELKPEELQILWFEFDDQRKKEKVMSFELKVDQDGRLPFWPDEMFKTHESLLMRLF